MILDPEILSKLSSIELRAKKIVEDLSLDYIVSLSWIFSRIAEHRPYNTGDDFKHIDWKAYAKKRFLCKTI